ncbi:MAG: addiction module toxin, HicA family [Planctomycetes bacterium]|nr:addiction module toxin, HicA family [Planctomycetota bacterium]
MKRSSLLRHLRRHGCVLKREGAAHSLWLNSATGAVQAVPRHAEIPDRLAHRICRGLGISRPGDDETQA